MSVAVAHQVRDSSDLVLAEGVRQAHYRGTGLVVIHVVDALDGDVAEATRAGISDSVDRVLKSAGVDPPDVDVRLVAGGHDIPDVSEAILTTVKDLRADLLVIGARRRSPVGKAFLGSVAQNVILDSEVPVLVVKSPR
jgi:nucleotide-binding universal stress UspA family protein